MGFDEFKYKKKKKTFAINKIAKIISPAKSENFSVIAALNKKGIIKFWPLVNTKDPGWRYYGVN